MMTKFGVIKEDKSEMDALTGSNESGSLLRGGFHIEGKDMHTAEQFLEVWKVNHPNSTLLDIKFCAAYFPVDPNDFWKQAKTLQVKASERKNFSEWVRPELKIEI